MIDFLGVKMEDIFQHQHKTDKLARNTLKAVSKILDISYKEACSSFINNKNIEVTIIFWALLNEEYPEKYGGVDFCRTCKKFVLHER